MDGMTATYSPEDNKLRLYPLHRLDKETYERVKAAGFRWAPKQELFVAPAWTPEREDLLTELCGEVGDEDTSLVDRAEERAERFDEYREHRTADAERAREAVGAIADNIPLGQPILVGHHSEARARRDAEKIENGMRRAVKMWRTAQYWKDRARGALRHAKYKELPAVRARRIKGIEADARKMQRAIKEQQDCLRLWESCTNLTQARLICGRTQAGWLPVVKHPSLDQYLHPSDVLPFDDRSDYAKDKYPTLTLDEVKARAREFYGDHGRCARWLEHYENRLTYERALLADSGGIATDRTKPERGGACRCWVSFHAGRWCKIQRVNRVSVTVLDNWGNCGPDFTRTVPFDKLHAVMSAAEVEAARAAGRLLGEDARGFTLAESVAEDTPAPRPEPTPQQTLFDGMADALRSGGVQVVSAPQLFPTPWPLAKRVVELADVWAEHSVLEPSAGTGRLLSELSTYQPASVVAVELSQSLADVLRNQVDAGMYGACSVRCADFLSLNGDLGLFDRIIMNPPFDRGADIRHIEHARAHLKPGGRLVAICANGPRQREALRPIAREWIDLEPGAFAESGTNVNAAIVVIDG